MHRAVNRRVLAILVMSGVLVGLLILLAGVSITPLGFDDSEQGGPDETPSAFDANTQDADAGDTPPSQNGDDAGSSANATGTDTDSSLISLWPNPELPATEQEGYVPPNADDTPGYLNKPAGQFAGFENVAEEVRLAYESTPRAGVIENHGVYVTDVNNNGHEDLLLIGGDRPVLFKNTGVGFERVQEFDPHLETEFFDEPGDAMMAAHFFDHNNNGYEDLLLTAVGEHPILYENVDGEFERSDVTFDVTMSYPTTITSADLTGNGCLDLYIGNWLSLEKGGQIMSNEEFLAVAKSHPEVRPETDIGGENYLLAGDCGSFEDITAEAGVAGSEFTLAVSAADFTGNGHIDIHVGNDFTGDVLYENQGDATFDLIDMGPASDRNAMSSVARDLTGNHKLDLFVTNVYYEDADGVDLIPLNKISLPLGNNLFANEGDGKFIDIAPEHGLEQGAWGWAATVEDYTNDGHLDIIHGSSYGDLAVVDDHPDWFRPPQVWKGTADSWEKVDGFDLGFDQHDLRGVASVDYNLDGTLDFVAVSTPSPNGVPGSVPDTTGSMLYENQLESEEFLQLWVRNPGGIERNADVYVETSERTIYRAVTAESNFLSQNSRLIHIGMGNEELERVVIAWPDGTTTGYESLASGNRYVLTPQGADRIQ